MTGSRAIEALAALSRTTPPLRGKRALALRSMRWAERRGRLNGTWRLRLKHMELELPRQSLMTWRIAFDGAYDKAALEQTAGFVRPGTVVLDVGASIGLWTVPLAKIAASHDASLWAFEPNPANTPWIRRNLALNNLSESVTVKETGLGDRRERCTLVSAEYGVGNGAIALPGAPFAGTRDMDKFPRIPVRIERLDDLELPAPVSFIKVDVEGYEAAFLRGATELIARDRPVIYGEFSSHWLTRRDEDLRSILAALDYDVIALRERRARAWRARDSIEPHPVDLAGSAPLPENLLLRPR